MELVKGWITYYYNFFLIILSELVENYFIIGKTNAIVWVPTG